MNESLKQLLQENNLGDYIALFEEQHLLSEEDFADLTEADYEKIGITKLGDLKRITKLFSKKESAKSETESNSSKNETESENAVIVKAEPVEEEFSEAGWDWCPSNLDGRNLVYCYGTSSKKYCPNCYRLVTAHDIKCPNCGRDFRETPVKPVSQPLPTYNPRPVDTSPIVINNISCGSKDNNEESTFTKNFNGAFHGILGGTFGALLGAAIVIIILLIILSNETISL